MSNDIGEKVKRQTENAISYYKNIENIEEVPIDILRAMYKDLLADKEKLKTNYEILIHDISLIAESLGLEEDASIEEIAQAVSDNYHKGYIQKQSEAIEICKICKYKEKANKYDSLVEKIGKNMIQDNDKLKHSVNKNLSKIYKARIEFGKELLEREEEK